MQQLISKAWFRYLAVGSTAYILEMATLFGLKNIFHLSPVRAVAVSFWVALIIAFVLQKLITFKNSEIEIGAIGRQLTGYGLLVAWNYIFTLVTVHFLVAWVVVYIARTVTIMIIMCWNYLFYKQIFKLPSH